MKWYDPHFMTLDLIISCLAVQFNVMLCSAFCKSLSQRRFTESRRKMGQEPGLDFQKASKQG
uniref:Uncharacterized protein n=1 Tax=Anguilla anguilla TaxID=7936 RepID=A0A0E9UB59_ANGAN